MNYVFSNYSIQKIVDSEDVYQQLKVIAGKQGLVEIKPTYDFYLPLSKEEMDKLVFIPALKFNNRAPIYKGSKAGELKIYLGNEYISSIDLEYSQSIESKDPLYHFRRIFRSINN